MIEQVTISINKSTFTAFYIGIRNLDDHSFNQHETDITRLPDFVTTLETNGFARTDSALGGDVVCYARKGNRLQEGIA